LYYIIFRIKHFWWQKLSSIYLHFVPINSFLASPERSDGKYMMITLLNFIHFALVNLLIKPISFFSIFLYQLCEKIISCIYHFFTSIKKRAFLIKVKNNFILLYMLFFLYNGWIRCSNTKTMNTLYNVCFSYLKKNYLADNFSTLHSEKFIFGFDTVSTKTLDFPANSYESLMVRFIKNIYTYNVIFNYFYLSNLKTDFITIKNDIEICYNNFISPLFWAFLALFLRL
jgi:hypothetical protein